VADGDDVQRTLALAKIGLCAPQRVRARVRAQLVESGAGAMVSGHDSALPAASGSSSVRVATEPSRAAGAAGAALGRASRAPWRSLGWALVGASVGVYAGYRIGFHHAEAALAALGSAREGPHASATREHTALHTDALSAETGSVAATVPPDGVLASQQGGFESTEARAAELDETTHRSPASKGDRDDVEATSPGAPAASSDGTRARRPVRRSPRAERLAGAVAMPSSPRTSEGGHVDHFAAEVALLQRAERAIRAGEGALALSFLDELEREFPDSSLRVERDTARVLARCQVTRTSGAAEREAARRMALELLSRGPSAYARRLSELCGLPAESGSAASEEVPRRGH
jgi:hypothetical protein